MNKVSYALVILGFCAGCVTDVAINQTPQCDGVQQPGEDTVDSPFDKDEDGFYDGSNPSCEAVYGAENLDCNDADASLNPGILEEQCNGIDDDCDEETPDGDDLDGDGFTHCDDCNDNEPTAFPANPEICGDSIDNNCDGEIDDGCVYDYNGTLTLDDDIQYSCLSNAVNMNFNQLLVMHQHPGIQAIAIGSSQPGTMTGSFTTNVDFTVARTIPGTCDETYRIMGTFSVPEALDTGDTSEPAPVTFDGFFQADFSGWSCGGCSQQLWAVTGILE